MSHPFTTTGAEHVLGLRSPPSVEVRASVEHDRWAAIVNAVPEQPGGNWQVLPENGLGALIAYAAGPGYARPHRVPLDQRQVTVKVTCHGRTTRRTEPMTPRDLESVQETLHDYFTDLGLPVPPVAWWEIRLPAGTDVDQLCAHVDELAAATPGADTGAGRARREAQTILAHVRGLYAEND